MDLLKNVPDAIGTLKSGVESRMQEINVEDVLQQAMKLPVAKVDREKFLRKELRNRYPAETVEVAIANNPAYAGIRREEIDKLAKNIINYETNKVSAISFATGLPGGIAMAATVSVDVLQYFTFILRVMQKLAYLYGFEEFELSGENIDDGTMNEILIFLGIMFGVQEANAAVKIIADVAARNITKRLAQKALMKGTIYPVVKKIAQAVGFKMTRQIFASGVGKMVPIAGGIVTGGITYATFKPCANNLKKSLSKLPVSDPAFYRAEKEYYTETTPPAHINLLFRRIQFVVNNARALSPSFNVIELRRESRDFSGVLVNGPKIVKTLIKNKSIPPCRFHAFRNEFKVIETVAFCASDDLCPRETSFDKFRCRFNVHNPYLYKNNLLRILNKAGKPIYV